MMVEEAAWPLPQLHDAPFPAWQNNVEKQLSPRLFKAQN
jgi:hypothetical protein